MVPLVTASQLKNRLYAQGFDTAILGFFQQQSWKFDRILPSLLDGSFITSADWSTSWERTGPQYVLGLAEALLGISRQPEIPHSPLFDDLLREFERDGYVLSGGRLVEADTSIVDVPAEVSLLRASIDRSRHDNKSVLTHHFDTAAQQLEDEHWGPTMGEWRKFFEEVLRGVWRFTRQKNRDAAAKIERPGMADLFKWLQEVGFFTADEATAYGAVYGFLSGGNHPGIRDRDSARFCMILAMTFGHSCLLKLESWTGTDYSI